MAGHADGAVPMTHEFDKHYWEQHWEHTHDTNPEVVGKGDPNPYLPHETSHLTPGTALDAGCGKGSEAIWLATHGWQVTAADISATALVQATERVARGGVADRMTLVDADLTSWAPGTRFDLVTTNYAHPAMPQLAFYRRISEWVAPGGTLLIVGHLHDPSLPADGHHPPVKASVTVSDITACFKDAVWEINTAEEHIRTVPGRELPLRDVVVRATRRSSSSATAVEDNSS